MEEYILRTEIVVKLQDSIPGLFCLMYDNTFLYRTGTGNKISIQDWQKE